MLAQPCQRIEERRFSDVRISCQRDCFFSTCFRFDHDSLTIRFANRDCSAADHKTARITKRALTDTRNLCSLNQAKILQPAPHTALRLEAANRPLFSG